jgi:methylornithine synthase
MIHNIGNFHILTQMIEQVKKKTGLPVMISPGVVPEEILHQFAAIKTDWYALYQETHNSVLFKKLRIGQSFKYRNDKRNAARRAGMLVEDGILLGVGETLSDRADSIMAMQQNDVDQVRTMSFVPQSQTPLCEMSSPSRMIECLCIAVMRLTMPNRLIPASLDVDGIKGLKMRLEAGANVITSIIPPNNRLAGVSQSSLDIEQGLRTVSEVKKVITAMGLRIASGKVYKSWMAERKEITARREHPGSLCASQTFSLDLHP